MTNPPSSPGKHAVTFVLITVFLDMVGFGIIMPVLPSLIQQVGHVSIADAARIGGWLFFAFSAAQFLFGPTMGNLSDAFGRRPLLLLAVFGLFIDYLLMSVAPNLFWLFVGRAIAGLCGASYVIANAYIADVTRPEDRAKAFGMIGAAFGLGFVIGPALGGLLGEYGARMPFYVAAGVSALNLVYGYFVLPETLAPSNRRAFEWQRANPLGTFKVFTTYHGVVPLSIVMFVYFFSSAVYPAIWAFWGIAKFGWSEWLVGLSLAAFGIVTAVFQGALTGPAVKLWGESKVALIGLVSAVIAAVGYGFAPGLLVVIIFFIVHGPEGFVHPMLTAIMSKAVPENAQGELQGGISSIMSVSMLLGTVFFSQVFGYFMQDSAPVTSTDMAFFFAAGLLVVTLAMFVVVRRRMAKSS
ncbi:MAG: TCR/Tet family MFS transporter [Phyllobacteriaceae bacterium]|nr:TCR/Tet family MFS transporter [Phyllobacteriaceae bacterium]